MPIYKILLFVLFFTLPLVHGQLFPTLWIDISLIIRWNFEFFKVTVFNILSALIFFSYFCSRTQNKVNIISSDIYIFLLLCVSSIFSLSPIISAIGDIEKWHTALMFCNLLWLFIILRTQKRAFLEKLILTSFVALCISCLIGLKEYFYPSFHYGELWNRFIWTYWHPNYFSWFVILALPFFILIKNIFLRYILGIIIWISLIISQSLVALFLISAYLWYILFQKKPYIYIWICSWIVLTLWISVFLLFPEKLHSFVSRYYLWETTVRIMIDFPRYILSGFWAETLPYYFESYKSPELYIFENYWYTADRPHNFFLNIFYHFWIFWILWFLYILIYFLKYFRSKAVHISLALFLLYGIFHYFSIVSYSFLIIVLALYYKERFAWIQNKTYYSSHIMSSIFVVISLIWGLCSINILRAEILSAQGKNTQAYEIFPLQIYSTPTQRWSTHSYIYWLSSPKSLRNRVQIFPQKETLCDELLTQYPSVENYFYCGQVFETLWRDEIAKSYYTLWLQKLPDLWNENSSYWGEYLIKNTITWNRFFSEKFWDIRRILEYTWK